MRLEMLFWAFWSWLGRILEYQCPEDRNLTEPEVIRRYLFIFFFLKNWEWCGSPSDWYGRSNFHWRVVGWWIAAAGFFNLIEDETTLVALVRVADPRRFSCYCSLRDESAANASSISCHYFVQSSRSCHVVMYERDDLPTYRHNNHWPRLAALIYRYNYHNMCNYLSVPHS